MCGVCVCGVCGVCVCCVCVVVYVCCVCVCVCVCCKRKSATLLPAAFTFRFGSVTRIGDEGTMDIIVPIVITINPPSAFLLTNTVIRVSVSGGNATGRLIYCSNITRV